MKKNIGITRLDSWLECLQFVTFTFPHSFIYFQEKSSLLPIKSCAACGLAIVWPLGIECLNIVIIGKFICQGSKQYTCIIITVPFQCNTYWVGLNSVMICFFFWVSSRVTVGCIQNCFFWSSSECLCIKLLLYFHWISLISFTHVSPTQAASIC